MKKIRKMITFTLLASLLLSSFTVSANESDNDPDSEVPEISSEITTDSEESLDSSSDVENEKSLELPDGQSEFKDKDIPDDAVQTYQNTVRTEINNQPNNNCHIVLQDDAVIKAINGKKVDNLQSGDFAPGTELEIDLNIEGSYRGFFWLQFTNSPYQEATGRFLDAEARNTIYIVPNQPYVRIARWGGGQGDELIQCTVIITDGRILSIDGKEVTGSVSEYNFGSAISTDSDLHTLTITTDGKESTDEFNYVFDRWVTDSSKLQILNPTQKTTEINFKNCWQPRVYAIYKAIPKSSDTSGEIYISLPENIDGLSIEGLEKAILTEEDKAIIESGKNINVFVTANELSQNSINASSLNIIKAAMARNSTIVKILDINIMKQIDGNSPQTISELQTPIKLTIDVPDSFVSKNKKIKRTFYVIRLHNNLATELPDIDDSENSATIESSLFSLYALAYSDENVTIPSTVTVSNAAPKTGDSKPIAATVLLLCLSFGTIVTILKKKSKYIS